MGSYNNERCDNAQIAQGSYEYKVNVMIVLTKGL